MPMVTISLTDEQKSQILDATGLDFESVTVERIDDDAAAELDLNVEELEDRVNPAIEIPAPAQIQGGDLGAKASERLQPGGIYLGIDVSGDRRMMQVMPLRDLN